MLLSCFVVLFCVSIVGWFVVVSVLAIIVKLSFGVWCLMVVHECLAFCIILVFCVVCSRVLF